MRESKIQRELIVGITALGGTAEKFTSPARRFVPDLLVCWDEGYVARRFWEAEPAMPHMEFIECKAPGGRLTSGQERDHARRRAMGFVVHVIWTMEQAEAYLRSRGKV